MKTINLIGKDGRVASVELEEGKNILDEILYEGIEAPYSCRNGKCSSCVAKVLDGTVDDRSDFLTSEEIEKGYVLLCTSFVDGEADILLFQEEAMLED